jgi:hypothetical protein
VETLPAFSVVGWVDVDFEKTKTQQQQKLFTRRVFSNFDKMTLLSSPSFNAVVELDSFSFCLLLWVVFFFGGAEVERKENSSRLQSFLLLFAMI